MIRKATLVFFSLPRQRHTVGFADHIHALIGERGLKLRFRYAQFQELSSHRIDWHVQPEPLRCLLGSCGTISGPKCFAMGNFGHGFTGCASGSTTFGPVSKRQHRDAFHFFGYTK
jgi:hypothetical protein